jgi:hypothetical protein
MEEQGKHTAKEDKKIAAEHYLNTTTDSETRRMYGHHFRSFIAGWDAAEVKLSERVKELEENCGILSDSILAHDAKIDALTSERDSLKEALGFLVLHFWKEGHWMAAQIDEEKLAKISSLLNPEKK